MNSSSSVREIQMDLKKPIRYWWLTTLTNVNAGLQDIWSMIAST